MKKTSKKVSNAGKTAIKIGAGLVAAGAAAAAGYYFYGSKGAKKHRKIAAKWAADMQKEVVREAKKLEKMTPGQYAALVDRIAKTYQSVRSIQPADVKRAANELKENLAAVQKETKRTVRKGITRAKAVVRRTK